MHRPRTRPENFQKNGALEQALTGCDQIHEKGSKEMKDGMLNKGSCHRKKVKDNSG